jgi:hypothetical protein
MKPARSNTARFVSRCPLIVLAVTFGLLLAPLGATQKIDAPPEVVLDYRCPTYVLPGNTPIIMRADIRGAKQLLSEPQRKSIFFKWELSEGRLLDGQGTEKVTVDTSSIGKGEISSIELKLQVEGAPPAMEREKTCTLRIDPQCNEPSLFDEYEGASGKEERQHLDRFAAYVKAAGPEATAYVISYEGRSACYYEAQWRADRATRYLVEKHGLSLPRVISVDGGVRERWSVDLFVQSQGRCGPLPRPELPRDEACFTGECSEKYRESP